MAFLRVVLVASLLTEFAPALLFFAVHPYNSQLFGRTERTPYALSGRCFTVRCHTFRTDKQSENAEKDAQAKNGGRNVSVLLSDRPVFAARLTKIHREGKVPPPEKSLFRVGTLVLLSIFDNLVHVALGMQGFAVFVGRDTAFFQSDGRAANTADESRMIWPRCRRGVGRSSRDHVLAPIALMRIKLMLDFPLSLL